MAIDTGLDRRFTEAADSLLELSSRPMMGGTCFFLNGNMLGGADRTPLGGRFMFRVGKDQEAEALTQPGASIVMAGKKRMGGMIFVDETVCDQRALRDWIRLAVSFVRPMPPK
ncbi:TfoX/Sxy family protein [Nisaea sp.]|uniref:TfoX/Sxy family protein n=1 Tax=Nisaea sp. TaxID=2024842 RepID=UPI0032993C3C